jgi:polyisoprenoid-binding protein YceI
MKKGFFLSLICFAFSQVYAQQEQWPLNTENSQISYAAKHLLHPWEGVNKKVKAVLKMDTDQMKITELAILTLVRDYDSKNTGRDAHALEVLEALSYPDVRFYADTFIPINDSLQIDGTLLFHGVSKPLSVKAHLKQDKKQWTLSGDFRIQPTHFGVALPSFMMVKMDDELRFTYRLTFDIP